MISFQLSTGGIWPALRRLKIRRIDPAMITNRSNHNSYIHEDFDYPEHSQINSDARR